MNSKPTLPTHDAIFRMLCDALFIDMGFDLDHNPAGTWGVDLRAEKGDETVLAEVKYTHRPRVYVRNLRDWVPAVAKLGGAKSPKVRLLVSGAVDGASRDWATREYGVDIWDRENLLEMASWKATREIFESFFELIDLDLLPNMEERRSTLRAQIDRYLKENDLSSPDARRGSKLEGRIKTTAYGAAGAKQYEALCVEVINFLFRDSLVDVETQSRSEDKLSVLDVVCRVSPLSGNPIWSTIARDFRARVIVFECKNYSDPIGPMQVYSTERYLSLKALRSVCFLLTRKQPRPNTFEAAQAAMRDTGRVVVLLDDEDLFTMLRLRDAQLLHERGSDGWWGQDPANHLDEKIYRLLATLPR